MAIELSKRRVAPGRLAAEARSLLEVSTLCAIATVTSGGQAHVNTAYFAWSDEFQLVWLSEPHAQHSRNVRANGRASVAVYDSAQRWGGRDRGIQLFGTGRGIEHPPDGDAEAPYAARFPKYRRGEVGGDRLFLFKSRRLKV